jgi:integrase/recombinase XerD
MSLRTGHLAGPVACRKVGYGCLVLGELRRCEVLGLLLGDIHVADRRVFVVDGKGGHQRWTPMANRFFTAVRHYLDTKLPSPTRTGSSSC